MILLYSPLIDVTISGYFIPLNFPAFGGETIPPISSHLRSPQDHRRLEGENTGTAPELEKSYVNFQGSIFNNKVFNNKVSTNSRKIFSIEISSKFSQPFVLFF